MKHLQIIVLVIAALVVSLVGGCGEFLPAADGSADVEVADGSSVETYGSSVKADGGSDGSAAVFGALVGDAGGDARAVEVTLVFTGIASAGSPNGTVVFDAAQTTITTVVTGAAPGVHGLELRPGQDCAAIGSPAIWRFDPFLADSMGKVSATFPDPHAREILVGKVFAFMEDNGNVSACGVAVWR